MTTRLDIKAILRDPVLCRKLFVSLTISTQARENVVTTQEQAEAAYDRVCTEQKLRKGHR